MSRLAPLDKALVLILVPIWVICFSLGVRTQIEGRGTAFIGVSLANADSYPAFTGEFPRAHPSVGQMGLRSGDLLVRVGGADLRGVGPVGLAALLQEEAGRDRRVAVVYERDGESHETSLRVHSLSLVRPWLASSLVWIASALCR